MTEDSIQRFLTQRSGASVRAARFRPMSSGEILDASITVYQSIGKTLLAATIVPAMVVTMVWLLVSTRVLPMLYTTRAPGNLTTEMTDAVLAIGLIFLVGLPAVLFVLSYSSAVVTQLVSAFYLGRIINVAETHLRTLRMLPRLLRVGAIEALLAFGLTALALLVILGSATADDSAAPTFWGAMALAGFLVLYASAIFVPLILCRLILVPVVAVLEPQCRSVLRRGVELLRAMPHNHQAVSGYGPAWRCFFLVVAMMIVFALGTVMVFELFGVHAAIATMQGPQVVRTLLKMGAESAPTFMAIWVALPVWCTTATLLYYDRRIRKEAFDIEVLASEVRRTDRATRFQL